MNQMKKANFKENVIFWTDITMNIMGAIGFSVLVICAAIGIIKLLFAFLSLP